MGGAPSFCPAWPSRGPWDEQSTAKCAFHKRGPAADPNSLPSFLVPRPAAPQRWRPPRSCSRATTRAGRPRRWSTRASCTPLPPSTPSPTWRSTTTGPSKSTATSTPGGAPLGPAVRRLAPDTYLRSCAGVLRGVAINAGMGACAQPMPSPLWPPSTQIRHAPLHATPCRPRGPPIPHTQNHTHVPPRLPPDRINLRSYNGFMDELAFAAAMLYKATGEEQYKADAERYFDQAEYSNTQEVGALKPLTAVLMAQLDPSNDKYFAEVGSGVCGWLRVWGEGGRAFGWEVGRGTMRGCSCLSGPWRAGDGVCTGRSATGPAAEAQAPCSCGGRWITSKAWTAEPGWPCGADSCCRALCHLDSHMNTSSMPTTHAHPHPGSPLL